MTPVITPEPRVKVRSKNLQQLQLLDEILFVFWSMFNPTFSAVGDINICASMIQFCHSPKSIQTLSLLLLSNFILCYFEVMRSLGLNEAGPFPEKVV